MKVYIGKPNDWFGPYQLAELLCFWTPKTKDEFGMDEKPDWVHTFGEFLAHGFHKESEDDKRRMLFTRSERPKTYLFKFLEWVNSKKIKKEYIKIDYWDTWSMDCTLSPIILPMLKQLKATKHGSGFIDLEDVPEHMRTTTTEDYDGQTTFDFYNEDVPKGHDVHSRYEWVLEEMIFAFEHLVDSSWEDKYHTGEYDLYSEPCKFDDDGKATLYQMKEGPKHTHKCDYDGLRKEWERVDNGLRLFGKYYRTLWD